mgnify:CR=1 FL=1
MQSLVVQISPTDPVTFVGITSLLSGRHARRVHHPGAESDAARSGSKH